MAGSKIIRQLLTERDMSVADLAKELNIKSQSMSNKLYRDNFSLEEFALICNILNTDVKAITRDTKKEFFETN